MKTLLTTTLTEMPLGSPGIVVATPDLSGHSDLGEAGRSWAIRQILNTKERS